MNTEIARRLQALQERLDVEFKDLNLLLEAITHRSFLNENREFTRHNEKLEFLGDAVLELAVSEYLFKRYRDVATEGELTHWRVALVNNDNLAKVGEELKLDEAMLCSHGQSKMVRGSKEWRYVMACAFEAILGAIFVDQGFGAARLVIDALLLAQFSQIIRGFEEHKSVFQELAQSRWGVTPHYTILKESGPDHAREYTVALYVGKKKVATGKGKSKKEAETAAAKAALQITTSHEGHLVEQS